MINLAHRFGMVAAVLEVLSHRDDVWQATAEMGLQVVNLGRVGPQAGHQAGARRGANRLLAVRPVEAGAGGGKLVEVGTFDVFRAVAGQLGPQIVDGNKEHIERFTFGRQGGVAGEETDRQRQQGKETSVHGEYPWGAMAAEEVFQPG